MINYRSVSRKLICAGALFGVFASSALGLGFGKMDVVSGLGEPFSARINLTSLYAGDSEQLSVTLASLEDFARAGIDRADILDKLQFAIAYDAGQPYVRVSSDGPIDEPLLQFLVALNWQGGKLVRNFNALLDPPTYARNGGSTPGRGIEAATETAVAETYSQPAQSIAQPIEPIEPVVIKQPSRETVIVESETGESVEQESIAATESADSNTQLSSFQVKRGQSLWIVADRTRDASTTVYQMMMAIYNANPRAFVRGDINKLKAGATLAIPAGEPRNELSHGEAVAAFQRTTQFKDSPNAIIAVSESESTTIQPNEASHTATDRPESAVTAMAPSNADDANQPGETIELTNARTDTNPLANAETAATSSELSGASAQFEQDANASDFALSNTDNKTLDLLTQEVALLESTLAQANVENQDLKERINDLENKVEFTTRFLEFQNIALSITDDDNASSINATVGNPAASATLETTQPVTIIEPVDNAGSNNTQTVIQEGLLAATEALSESGDTLTQSEQNTLAAPEQQSNLNDNNSSMTDAASSNADSGESRWTTFQDKVVTRFDGLKSLFATSTSQTMQPVLAMIAVVILALGVLVAIFRHRSFAPVQYTAYSSNSGSIARSVNRRSLQSFGTKAANAAKKRSKKSEKTASVSASSATSGGNANVDKQSVKYAGASTLIEQAEVYMALGREDKAEETLKNAIKGGSVDTEASMKLMEIYQKRPPGTFNPTPKTDSGSRTQRATTAPSAPTPDPASSGAIKPPTPEVIPDPDIMQALVPSAPTADSEQAEALEPSASEIRQAESKTITIPPVSGVSKPDDNTPAPSIPVPDPGQIEAAKSSMPATIPDKIEPLRPRVEKPVERSPLDQLSTAPLPSKSGDGIPMFDVGDDGLSSTERAALRKAVMTAEVDTKPDDFPAEPEPKIGRRSKLLQAARGTQFETRSKEDQIKDLETKLDSLQNQMDELLRRLSRDDSSNSSGGAA